MLSAPRTYRKQRSNPASRTVSRLRKESRARSAASASRHEGSTIRSASAGGRASAAAAATTAAADACARRANASALLMPTRRRSAAWRRVERRERESRSERTRDRLAVQHAVRTVRELPAPLPSCASAAGASAGAASTPAPASATAGALAPAPGSPVPASAAASSPPLLLLRLVGAPKKDRIVPPDLRLPPSMVANRTGDSRVVQTQDARARSALRECRHPNVPPRHHRQ